MNFVGKFDRCTRRDFPAAVDSIPTNDFASCRSRAEFQGFRASSSIFAKSSWRDRREFYVCPNLPFYARVDSSASEKVSSDFFRLLSIPEARSPDFQSAAPRFLDLIGTRQETEIAVSPSRKKHLTFSSRYRFANSNRAIFSPFLGSSRARTGNFGRRSTLHSACASAAPPLNRILMREQRFVMER
jgi:hypothetical protein